MQETEASSMQRQQRSPLVFVVDDDPTTVITIRGLMKRAGFRTASAGNAADALRGIREQHPDLILLDVNLPDGCGFDVCRRLGSEASAVTTPVLFISANQDTSSVIKGFACGGVDYITKPIVGAEVIARVRTHLRLRQAYEKLAELHAERVQQLASAQRDLMPLPKDLPEARFQVSLRQVLTAGGDFYDVIPAGGDVVDYLVADASGHNLAASLWTATLKALAAEYAGPLNSPLEIVHAINSSLCRILPPAAFFTLIYMRLNHATGQLSMVNAGHPPAIVTGSGGGQAVILRVDGDVVGAFGEPLFGIVETTLKPGERIFLYTDGLIETGGTHEEGLQRMAAACVLRGHLPLNDAVPAVVEDVMADLPRADDTLLVGIER